MKYGHKYASAAQCCVHSTDIILKCVFRIGNYMYMYMYDVPFNLYCTSYSLNQSASIHSCMTDPVLEPLWGHGTS